MIVNKLLILCVPFPWLHCAINFFLLLMKVYTVFQDIITFTSNRPVHIKIKRSSHFGICEGMNFFVELIPEIRATNSSTYLTDTCVLSQTNSRHTLPQLGVHLFFSSNQLHTTLRPRYPPDYSYSDYSTGKIPYDR